MAIDRRLLTYINWGLVAATLLLFWVGIGNLYSASGVRVEDGISLAPYYERQMIWGAFGLIAMVACMSFDYRHLQAMALPFFLIVLFSLCLIPLFGKVIYGARRWIDLGFFHFQPSEMAKIAVLLMGAQVLSLDGEPLSWKKLFQVSCVGGIPAAFIVCQPDLGHDLVPRPQEAGAARLPHQHSVAASHGVVRAARLPEAAHYDVPRSVQ